MDWFFPKPRRYTQTYPQKLGKPLDRRNLLIRIGKKVRKTGLLRLVGSLKQVSWDIPEATPIIADKISTDITGLF